MIQVYRDEKEKTFTVVKEVENEKTQQLVLTDGEVGDAFTKIQNFYQEEANARAAETAEKSEPSEPLEEISEDLYEEDDSGSDE